MLDNSYLLLAAAKSGNSSPLVIVIALVGFALAFGIVFYLVARQKKAMADFALKNGWQAINNDDSTLANYVPTYLLNNSESLGHKYEMAYSANVSGQNIIFFKYDDSVRVHEVNNPSANEQIVSSIAAFEVQQSFNNLLILHHSRVANFGLHPDLQKFNLEGDFSNYFDVYAPQGSSIETLSLLTPDIMAFLIDQGKHAHWNIQIKEHVVSIEGDAYLISPSKITDLLNYAVALKQKLDAKPVLQADAVSPNAQPANNQPQPQNNE